jgi:hypothetical protein
MRFLGLILTTLLIGFSCVKPQSKDPVPSGEFKDFVAFQNSLGNDTAILTVSYEDGDGDLFVTNKTEGPNVVFVPYFYNETTQKFTTFKNLVTQDTQRINRSVLQPADGYYKGRSIKGDIIIPLSQFRPNNQAKIMMFKGYLKDTKGNKSNTITSPIYTINF